MHENMLCINVADMVLCGNNVFIYNSTQYLWATRDQELFSHICLFTNVGDKMTGMGGLVSLLYQKMFLFN